MFTAAICFCADLITVYLIDKKLQLIRLASIEYHFRYLIYVVIVIVGTMIAVSMS